MSHNSAAGRSTACHEHDLHSTAMTAIPLRISAMMSMGTGHTSLNSTRRCPGSSQCVRMPAPATRSWTEASKKWTNVTVEVPKGVKPSYTEMAYIYAIPGVNQAVAAGSIETTAGSWVSCFWHWNGGATWKVTTVRV